MAIKKTKQKITRVDQDVEKWEPFCTEVGNVKLCCCRGKWGRQFLKNRAHDHHRTQQFHFWVDTQKNRK